MGLTIDSVGKKAAGESLSYGGSDIVVMLAGNPNVGKSTVFNALTGLNQHTGNWPGKTVTSSIGKFSADGKEIALVDLPGTYSLLPHSEEERVARDCICGGDADVTVVVCDATTIARCMNLVLQILEITNKVIVCVNLIDQAKKKKIDIDTKLLSSVLHVPVVETNARGGKGLDKLTEKILELKESNTSYSAPFLYDTKIETAVRCIKTENFEDSRFFRLRLIYDDKDYISGIENKYDCKIEDDNVLTESIKHAKTLLDTNYINNTAIRDSMAATIINECDKIAEAVTKSQTRDDRLDRKLDKIFTGKYTAVPIMLLMLAVVFFITIYAANYPSQLLSKVLFSFGDVLRNLLDRIGAAWWITEPLIDGVYTVMAWVVSVMLPPMAIFFPMFTLLEDFGYLPRMAFNLDKCFQKCNACGKQSLCMAMGFGCNAAGIVGCRIIDSPRERLIAILTNSFVPCNGRFPTIIAIISMFFVASLSGVVKSASAALILTAIIILSVAVTLTISKLLSKTLLKGTPSSFTLELPSYRPPKVGSVIVRSIFDRTLFVLARAVSISAPMGLIIWLLANVKIADTALITLASDYLDPLGKLMGLDGVIILAFILGFPANEIVLPITLMCYLSQGTLVDITDYGSIFAILSQNGWTWVTGICFILFSLLHFPCSTTLMTIKKETGSMKYTALSFMIPTVIGFVMCVFVRVISLIATA
ncbi:MAG: ferrous iron transport protein B [Faecalibacterium sp.]|nr:ferrous iron transport protein B [Ruminococcus sp.]MCM1392478.1 ferrous iron transport protein B [Ruminococcus sp.]MCM1485169.1 ferrous iron transport protein B [Faecalibacterium sp.]